MLLATAEDCRQKSLKRLARDDDIVSSSASHSSFNKKQPAGNQILYEPDNLKVSQNFHLSTISTSSPFIISKYNY